MEYRPAPVAGARIAVAVSLFALALILAVDLVLAAFSASPLPFPGRWLAASISWAAFVIPAVIAAFGALALSERYRPDVALALALSPIPLAPLGALARFLGDPESAFRLVPAVEPLGVPGTAGVVAALFFVALLFDLWISFKLFPGVDDGDGDSLGEDAATRRDGARDGETAHAFRRKRYLPIVGEEPGYRDDAPPCREAEGEESEPRARDVPDADGEPGFGLPDDTPTRRVLDEAEGFEFRVPELPARRRLRSLGEDPDPAEEGSDFESGGARRLEGRGEEEARGPEAGGDAPSDLATPAAEAVIGESPEREGPEDAIPVMFGSLRARNASSRAADADADTPDHDDAEDPRESPRVVVASGQLDPIAIPFTSVPPKHGAEEARATGDYNELAASRRPKKARTGDYAVPTDILKVYPDGQYWIVDDKTRANAEVLRETLAEFNIEATVTGIRKGPVITMYEILPAPGVKLSRITALSDNIALRLAAQSVRIVAPIPGKHAVGIEVPNAQRSIVSFREIVEGEAVLGSKHELPVVLGKDITGEAQVIDLAQTPHLLIAGATGSGKSVCVNALILSLLYARSPERVKMILIDPKIVELKLYNDIPHLLTPVITEPKRAFQALQYCICEMERRYTLLDRMGVRDIKSYNRKVREKNLAAERLPYLVVFIDEFADLMATTGKELESTLARLAAMSRAVGIHLVLATQRPSIDVITGLIKANIPSRIAFMVASKFDSRIIIDAVGAEKLLAKGDMLLSSAWDSFPIRMQGAYVSEEEVERVVEHVKTLGEPEYIDDEIFIEDEEEDEGSSLFDDDVEDPMFEKALEIVLQQGKASASFIQRRLKIGYNRAARLVELMEERGIVGPAQGSKPRNLLKNPDVASRPRTDRAEGEEYEA